MERAQRRLRASQGTATRASRVHQVRLCGPARLDGHHAPLSHSLSAVVDALALNAVHRLVPLFPRADHRIDKAAAGDIVSLRQEPVRSRLVVEGAQVAQTGEAHEGQARVRVLPSVVTEGQGEGAAVGKVALVDRRGRPVRLHVRVAQAPLAPSLLCLVRQWWRWREQPACHIHRVAHRRHDVRALRVVGAQVQATRLGRLARRRPVRFARPGPHPRRACVALRHHVAAPAWDRGRLVLLQPAPLMPQGPGWREQAVPGSIRQRDARAGTAQCGRGRGGARRGRRRAQMDRSRAREVRQPHDQGAPLSSLIFAAGWPRGRQC